MVLNEDALVPYRHIDQGYVIFLPELVRSNNTHKKIFNHLVFCDLTPR